METIRVWLECLAIIGGTLAFCAIFTAVVVIIAIALQGSPT